VDAVLETSETAGFTAWPIAEPPAGDHVLALSGQMTPAEVGTAMAVIFRYDDIPAGPIGELHHLLDRHLVAAGALIAPGGLRVRDMTTGAEILPGCCCGLGNWREWRNVLHKGEDLWLGHDPGTDLEYVVGTVRLRQEPGARSLPSSTNPSSSNPSRNEVEIRLDEVPALLIAAHLRLRGFLDLVRRWAGEAAPQAADRLVTILDESFDIHAPLETPS
jgi:hypothetical protein